MTRNNACQHLIDISEDILFKSIEINGSKPTAFLRMYGFVKGTAGAAPVKGLRYIAYGPLAELVYAYVRKGSRLLVFSHVQQRETDGKFFTEFVIEECQFVRNVDFDAGRDKHKELIDRGEMLSNSLRMWGDEDDE